MTDIDTVLEALEPIASVAIPAGVLLFTATAIVTHRWRELRREWRIARAGSAEEWQAARHEQLSHRTVRTWPRWSSDAIFLLGGLAPVALARDLKDLGIILAIALPSTFGLHFLLKRRWPEAFERHDSGVGYAAPPPDTPLPREAVWGFAAAVGIVAAIVGAILLLR